MRIIRGKYGGRRIDLKAPPGVRPTMDSVRESLFNMLENIMDIEDAKVLELYSGSALFSLECLSRGAGTALAVDKSWESLEFSIKCSDILGITEEEFDTYQMDAIEFISNDKDMYDIIFFDPPYDMRLTNQIIRIIAERKLLSRDGIIIAEHSRSEKLICPEDLNLIKEKNYGKTSIEILEWGE